MRIYDSLTCVATSRRLAPPRATHVFFTKNIFFSVILSGAPPHSVILSVSEGSRPFCSCRLERSIFPLCHLERSERSERSRIDAKPRAEQIYLLCRGANIAIKRGQNKLVCFAERERRKAAVGRLIRN